jgi:hypothetical protein
MVCGREADWPRLYAKGSSAQVGGGRGVELFNLRNLWAKKSVLSSFVQLYPAFLGENLALFRQNRNEQTKESGEWGRGKVIIRDQK